jgi:hypothetical protein
MGNKLVYGVIAVVLLLGVFLPLGQESRTVVERVTNTEYLGAVNTPDLAIGGMRLVGQETNSLTATNTVICSIQSPSSTSTLQALASGIMTTFATSSATNLSISKSTTNATIGTVLASTSVSSGAYKTLVAATTTPVVAADIATGVANLTFAPNTFFNVAMTGGGILAPVGNCQALWVVN